MFYLICLQLSKMRQKQEIDSIEEKAKDFDEMEQEIDNKEVVKNENLD